MNFASRLTFTLASTALVATPLLAQQQRQRVSSECRQEIMQICASDGQRDRSKIRACVEQNVDKLSEGCSAEVKTRMEARQQVRSEKQPDNNSSNSPDN
ncbi:MAG: hypothetical protein AAGK02_09780 [Pseudomonadota bacterium]